MTKYLCMASSCNFVTEDEQEATDHIGSHSGDPEAAIAEVSYDSESGTSCSTFRSK